MVNLRNDRILIIDDNPSIHEDFRKILEHRGGTYDAEATELFLGSDSVEEAPSFDFNLTCVSQGQDALAELITAQRCQTPFAVAFVDMRMPPGWDGLRTIQELWKVDPDLQVVICSAYSDHSWSDIISQTGATDRLLILKKPFDRVEVIQMAVALTEKWHLTKNTRQIVEDRTKQLVTAENSLMRRSVQLELAANLASLSYWTFDLDTQCLSVSPGTNELLGIEATYDRGLDSLVAIFTPQHRDALDRLLDRAVALGEDFEAKTWLTNKQGETRHVQIRTTCKRHPDETLASIFGVMQDVTQSEAAIQAVQHASLHDQLTDLPNRAKLLDHLDAALKRTRRDGAGTNLVLLDIDHFQNVNDTLGHHTGDDVLREFSARLRRCTRESDIVARIGADEFAIIQSNAQGPRDTIALLERIHETSSDPRFSCRPNGLCFV